MSHISIIKTQMVDKPLVLQALTDLGLRWGVLGTSEKDFTDRLNQRDAYLAVKSKLEEQGFSLASEERNSGKIHLVLRRVA